MNGGVQPGHHRSYSILGCLFVDAESGGRVRVLRWCRAQSVIEPERNGISALETAARPGVVVAVRICECERWLPDEICQHFTGAGDFPIDDVIRALWQARVAHRVTRDGHAQLGEPGDLRCAQLSSSGPWTGRGVAGSSITCWRTGSGYCLRTPGERTAVARWVEEVVRPPDATSCTTSVVQRT